MFDCDFLMLISLYVYDVFSINAYSPKIGFEFSEGLFGGLPILILTIDAYIACEGIRIRHFRTPTR